MNNSAELFEQIKVLAESAVVCDVGWADLRGLRHPLSRKFASAVSVIVPFSRGVLKGINDKPTITYYAHYRAVNRAIDDLTLKITLLLEQKGFEAFPVPASQSDPFSDDPYSAVFQHKTAAVLAGKGWIGKNALFIHPQYGPAVRLGTVLTTLEGGCASPMASRCGDWQQCKRHCPAMAIEGGEWQPGMPRNQLLDARACSAYMKEQYQDIGRGSVCGLCIVHCPFFQ